MATTTTIEFSNEKRTGTFKYTNGNYIINGNASASFDTNTIESVNGNIILNDVHIGSFYANKQNDNMTIGLNGVEASYLSSVSTVITDCIAKINSYYV